MLETCQLRRLENTPTLITPTLKTSIRRRRLAITQEQSSHPSPRVVAVNVVDGLKDKSTPFLLWQHQAMRKTMKYLAIEAEAQEENDDDE